MTTAVKNVEILSTLEEDPHVTFFAWESDIQDSASGMAKSVHPLGLLSDILTDEQWAAYPGNTTIVNAQPQIALRYTLQPYVEIVVTMTNAELYVAKAANERSQVWIDSAEALKRAVIKSLGRTVRQMVRAPKVRFQRMSVAEIMAKVRARFGRMQRDTKTNLREKMLTMLTTADKLDTHISDLQDMFEVSETASFPIDEDTKIDIFRETVSGHPLILRVLEKFDFDFPDSKACTYAQICEYIVKHLPNLKSAQAAATKASANLVAATAYATLEAESQRLKTEVEQLKRKQNPNNRKPQPKRQQGKTKGGEKRNAGEPTTKLKYCHGHGYQKSHLSSECKLLAGDKKFTAEMRRAKDPNHPPGGSTKVNGQPPQQKPKSVVANIAHNIQSPGSDSDHNEEANSDHNDETSDCFEETAVFLSSLFEDQTDTYTVTETSAMMMEDEFILLEDTVESVTHRQVLPTNEVPRLSLDESQGGQKHGRGESDTVIPTQTGPLEGECIKKETNQDKSNETNLPPKSKETNQNKSNETSLPPNFTLITDGSQFRKPFWEAEVQSLQDFIRRQVVGVNVKDSPPRRIPTADELQIEFVTWLLAKPDLPLLVAPASSGFYSETYGYRIPLPDVRATSSGFYDEEYVAGKRTLPRDSLVTTLNPAKRLALSYNEVYTAELTTAIEIERHERR